MRFPTLTGPAALAGLTALALAGCVAAGVPQTSYDPHLYDANGNVVPPVAQALPAQAPPAQPECREVERSITVGGQPQQAYARACLQPDGSWRFTD